MLMELFIFIISIYLFSKQINRLGLADFRNLLMKIEKPEHVKYAVLAAELYNKKGNDFSVEVNALFIRSCLKGNNTKAVIDHFKVFSNRLSAWTGIPSFNRLLESIIQENVTENVAEVVDILKKKGLSLKYSYDVLMKLRDSTSDEALKNKIIEILKQDMGEEYATYSPKV